jgi:hypothetical protein
MMASPVQTYQRELHDNLGFFATWLPGDLLELGDIGILKDGRFRKESSLQDLGVNCQASPLGPIQNLQYSSKSGTSVSIDTSASAAPGPVDVSAKIDVAFSLDGSFLFHASNVRNRRLENSTLLADSLLELWEKRAWNKNWYLIESLHQADCATVIVAEDTSAGVTFTAKGSIVGVPLADPNVELSIVSSKGKMTQVIAGRNLRLLYSCLRVHEGIFSGPSVQPVRGVGGGATETPLVRAGVAELLNS